jgi:hypothetical protein
MRDLTGLKDLCIRSYLIEALADGEEHLGRDVFAERCALGMTADKLVSRRSD